MGIIITIAWRNLWRHKGKSLIVGAILFVGAAIMTIGTGVITGMNQGLSTHIVDGFTGDMVLVSEKQQGDNVFINMMGQAIEPLPPYQDIKEALRTSPLVNSYLPMGKNMAMVLNEEGGSMDGAFLLGVDIAQYDAFFDDNFEMIQGRTLTPGERGVLLATGSQKIFLTSMGLFFMPESCAVDTSIMPDEAKQMGNDLTIKRSMVFMGFGDNNASTDIRLPIRGLMKYKALNTLWGGFILMDIESYRQCLGYISAAQQQVQLSDRTKTLLSTDGSDIESLFSGSELLVENERKIDSVVYTTDESAAQTKGEAAQIDLDAGTYNLVLVKLKDGVTEADAGQHLDSLFAARDIGIKSIAWHNAIGTIGSLAMLIKSSLFVFVMVLFFVAIVIIINTLTMAALERTPEIGMMRAIGAYKRQISYMFIAETGLLAAFFGSIGIAFGWGVVTVLSALHITTGNDMVQLIYGGDRFHPFLTGGDFALVALQLFLVVCIAVVYPLIVARNITPLDAVSRE